MKIALELTYEDWLEIRIALGDRTFDLEDKGFKHYAADTRRLWKLIEAATTDEEQAA